MLDGHDKEYMASMIQSKSISNEMRFEQEVNDAYCKPSPGKDGGYETYSKLLDKSELVVNNNALDINDNPVYERRASEKL